MRALLLLFLLLLLFFLLLVLLVLLLLLLRLFFFLLLDLNGLEPFVQSDVFQDATVVRINLLFGKPSDWVGGSLVKYLLEIVVDNLFELRPLFLALLLSQRFQLSFVRHLN